MLNKVILIGNLGNDPEVRTLDNGNQLANFSLATSETYTNKNSGEKVTNTEWHRCVAYGKPAEIIGKYTKKGSKLYVEGSIHTRSWEDNNGEKRYSTEIKVREFKFLSSVGEGNAPAPAAPAAPNFTEEEEDDLPF